MTQRLFAAATAINNDLSIMTLYPKGSFITNGGNGLNRRKVLAAFDDIRFVSAIKNYEVSATFFTVHELQTNGCQEEKKAWEPEVGMKYFYITNTEEICPCIWYDDKVDNARRGFLGVYETEELTKQAVAEIRKKLGK